MFLRDSYCFTMWFLARLQAVKVAVKVMNHHWSWMAWMISEV